LFGEGRDTWVVGKGKKNARGKVVSRVAIASRKGEKWESLRKGGGLEARSVKSQGTQLPKRVIRRARGGMFVLNEGESLACKEGAKKKKRDRVLRIERVRGGVNRGVRRAK